MKRGVLARARALVAFVAGGLLLAVPGLNLIPVGYAVRLMANASRGERAPTAALGPLGLTRDLGLGLAATLGTVALLSVPSLFLYLGWVVGWTLSFEFVDTWEPVLERVGHGISVVGALLLAPLLAYLPAALVHFARSGRMRALFDVTTVIGVVRRAPWAWWRASLLVPLFGAPHVVLRTITAASQPEDQPVTLRLIANLLVLGPFLVARWSWARTWAKHAADEGRPLSTASRLGLAIAYFVVAAASVLVTAASVFMAAHGPWDFFTPPLLTVPTVPYPGGLYVPAARL